MASSRSQKQSFVSRKTLTGILVATLALGIGFGGYHYFGGSQDSENSGSNRLPSTSLNPSTRTTPPPEPSIFEKPKEIAATAQNWFEKSKESKPSESALPIPGRTGGPKGQGRTPVAHYSHKGKTQKIHKSSKKRSHKGSKFAKKTKKKKSSKHKISKKSKQSRLKHKSVVKKRPGHKNKSKKFANYKKKHRKSAANQ